MRVFARRREDGYLHRFLTRTRLELCQWGDHRLPVS